jgi:predicted dehydrogenase
MRFAIASVVAAAIAAGGGCRVEKSRLEIVTVDPGHFHAALLQKEMLPEFSEHAYVYAPLGPDLAAHLNRVAGFNARKEHPTAWKLSVYAGADYWEKMLADRRGQVVVFSGRNRGKIDRVREVLSRGVHVLADKPWIIEPEDLPKLEAALNAADSKRVIGYDGMTQRFEISCILQKALVNAPGVFGEPLQGTADDPGVYMESVHYLLKLVAGAPNLRPVWFFDTREQGEGLTDVGTHLVDLVQWTLLPDQAVDYQKDIEMVAGSHWPTTIPEADFKRVTGAPAIPESLRGQTDASGALAYYCNNRVDYKLKGVHVRLDVKWDFEAPPGGADTEVAIYRGSRARVEVRQGAAEKFRPEVYVIPNVAGDKAAVAAAIRQLLASLEAEWPGLDLVDQGDRLHVTIPDKHRIGHEAHFALLTARFLSYVKNPQTLPAWEKPNMLAKYYVTTKGVELARRATRP